MKNLNLWLRDEEGQGMLEYSLVIGFVAVVSVAVLIVIGNKVKSKLDSANVHL